VEFGLNWRFFRSVSIHAPTRGATDNIVVGGIGVRFQSTPPRGGRHKGIVGKGAWDGVSIHAPTRGATQYKLEIRQLQNVSIHAPTRGATLKPDIVLFSSRGFNPRPHAGGDVEPGAQPVVFGVSIHAPTRGATRLVLQLLGLRGVSIHAPTRGATFTTYHFCAYSISVSIHAPTRGATNIMDANTSDMAFQSTPPRGGRLALNPASHGRLSFNPRPHAGGDSRSSSARAGSAGFNPRPHAGGD